MKRFETSTQVFEVSRIDAGRSLIVDVYDKTQFETIPCMFVQRIVLNNEGVEEFRKILDMKIDDQDYGRLLQEVTRNE